MKNLQDKYIGANAKEVFDKVSQTLMDKKISIIKLAIPGDLY